MRHHRPSRTLLAVLTVALATGAALAVPAQAAAPSVELQPQMLDRGDDIAIPHIEDGDYVDGARRVELPGTVARIIGPSMGGWMVGTHRTNAVGEPRGGRVVHVTSGEDVRTVLRDVHDSDVVVSEDGSALLAVVGLRNRSATVKVWAPVDGRQTAQRRFRGFPQIVAADGVKVLVRTTRGTFWWKFVKDNVRPVTTHLTGSASIEHNLLSVYTKDPYLGGCTRLVRLRQPKVTVWKSCRDRVAAFSPDGTQMLTVHILSDGLGPSEIRLRDIDGTRLASYTTDWFGGWEWESPGTLLLDVNGTTKSATVRCTLDVCDNATDLIDRPANLIRAPLRSPRP